MADPSPHVNLVEGREENNMVIHFNVALKMLVSVIQQEKRLHQDKDTSPSLSEKPQKVIRCHIQSNKSKQSYPDLLGGERTKDIASVV